jgi:CheY-like chemotaxis protein/HPt (histidine-containing phosphotransfer) domain-containing protein
MRAPQFQGLRVLLADDNLINQEVAAELLRGSGVAVDVANNGAQAVEMAQRESYDLIFLDMQMPIMDGLEAARAIRRLAGRQDTPIVAMTANAFEEDREQCLAAGMNDHVGKPVQLRVLHEALQRWLPAQPASVPRTSAPATPPSLPDRRAQLERIPGLQIKVGLGYVQNRLERYEILLQKFVASAKNDLLRLRAALTNDDRTGLARAAHSLRGAAAVVGATAMENAAQSIETAVRAGGSGEELRRTIEALEAVHSALSNAVQASSAASPAAH